MDFHEAQSIAYNIFCADVLSVGCVNYAHELLLNQPRYGWQGLTYLPHQEQHTAPHDSHMCTMLVLLPAMKMPSA